MSERTDIPPVGPAVAGVDATAETVGPPVPRGPKRGVGRVFLFLLGVAAALGALRYFEMEGVSGDPLLWRAYAIIGALGLFSLILLLGALRGRRLAIEAVLARAGAAEVSAVALEDAEGHLLYANAPFRALLRAGGASLREEEDLWTVYAFPKDSAQQKTFARLRGEALAGVTVRDILGSAETTGAADGEWTLVAVPTGIGEIIWLASETRGPGEAPAATIEPETGDLSIEIEELRRQLETLPIGMVTLDTSGRILDCNPASRDLLGADAPVGERIVTFVGNDFRPALAKRLAEPLDEAGMAVPLDVEIAGSGHRMASVYFSRPSLTETGGEGTQPGRALYLIDTTEQKRLEIQFAQSQKMQAVGQLAGGIAHDFNNLLTAMVGFCDLLLQRFKPGDQSFTDIMQIKQNANRGARLVRQLLAFSRQQTLQPRVLDVTQVLAELSNLLHRLLGESVELDFVHSRELGKVKVDQGQLEQVIINLAVNARDAMPDGGSLTVSTRNCNLLSEVDRAHAEIMPPGAYVMITVEDNGTGMTQEVLDRIFDPFYTTKEVGRGTGLGLATVYGIIKQTGGFVFADSEGMGKGTTFTIYLQRYEGPEVARTESAETQTEPVIESVPDPVPEGNGAAGEDGEAGTILLVEDEDPVRRFGARALRNSGYRVVEAQNGEVAIELLEQEKEKYDLLITDMVMPKANGPMVIAAARKKMPDLPVICISGYTQESIAREVENIENVSFLAKPFSLKQLAGRVQEVLEAQAPRA
jgi:two-component system cell cycle sensor histidine kinase/response regulator CckA